MTFRFLSFGAGVQTTALLLMDSYDEVVFADTGGEKQQTYNYIQNVIIPFLHAKGTKFTVLRRKSRSHGTESLEEFCLRTKNVPSIKYRWSTRDFKVLPIRKYIKKNYAPPVICAIGISTDEVTRANSKDPPEYHKIYPLIEQGLSRQDCVKVIQSHGWLVPPRSGCFYCPFNTRVQWNWLYLNDRPRYDRATVMEANAKLRRPRLHLSSYANNLAEQIKQFNESLDSYPAEGIPDICESGYCMT